MTGVGELDLATAPLLTAEVRAVCRAALPGDVREFLLDLEGVTFLDSTGLRCAERAELAARNGGLHVRVRPPAARGPRQLLRLAHPARDDQELPR
ncbi:STAS domain-containing protein [Sporichthya sp.]|uniref:STAS domain-containing protein n=1 Tax=Sporichthya sp. TaxID=65475 RepID=UPI0018287CA9|nr:STAS domain-containing protein [Sporichthya sp.]MBA3742531.1 STAS domain-containing protein [Sporichthya sp.]